MPLQPTRANEEADKTQSEPRTRGTRWSGARARPGGRANCAPFRHGAQAPLLCRDVTAWPACAALQAPGTSTRVLE